MMKRTISVLLVLSVLMLSGTAFASSMADMLGGDPAPVESEWDGEYAGLRNRGCLGV